MESGKWGRNRNGCSGVATGLVKPGRQTTPALRMVTTGSSRSRPWELLVVCRIVLHLVFFFVVILSKNTYSKARNGRARAAAPGEPATPVANAPRINVNNYTIIAGTLALCVCSSGEGKMSGRFPNGFHNFSCYFTRQMGPRKSV